MGDREGAHTRSAAGGQDRHRLCAQRHGMETGARAEEEYLSRGKTMSQPRRALDGVRVLALETSLSGPHATKILADMGADVVMVEKPGTGNVIRTWDTAVKGMSSGIAWIGPNKKSLAINVKKPAAREILQRLAKHSDVLLENFAP